MKITIKKSTLEESQFISFIHSKNSSFWKKSSLTEHDLIKEYTSNNQLVHYNHLLFYHWYERRNKVSVINTEILRSLNKEINVTKKELHDDVRDRMLDFMNSQRFLGYTIYYEYFFDFFPENESFDFTDFVSGKFINYLLDLFPICKEINYCGKHRLIRFNGKQLRRIEENGSMILYYGTNHLPSFYPHVHDSIEYYTHNPHKFLEKNRKEIENIIRVEKSLPKIGEGWISETILYYQVKEALPEFEVVHHASPPWLGRQHFDIYLPKLNIAIEYQGKQHNEPIEFFGGNEAFLKNQERDERKRQLSENNHTKLFYVYPETDTLKFITELKKIIKEIGQQH